MKKILVTGGAGFIGSNLIDHLIFSDNCQVTCIDNFDNYYSPTIKSENIKQLNSHKNFKMIQGSILDPLSLRKIDEIDSIIHLAAKAGVRPSISNLKEYERVNIDGTRVMLEFAKSRNIRNFIFSSSSSVYGVNPDTPWNESHRTIPISPYAKTKCSCEAIGEFYSKSYGIKFLALRLFTVYGLRQRPDLAISKFFTAIMNNSPITVYGSGESIRDYTHVNDIIRGISAALEYDGSLFEIINLASNSPVKLKFLIKQIESITGKKAYLNYLPDQHGDVPITYADISKAEKLLQYKPIVSLNEGLKSYFETNYIEHTNSQQ